MKIMEQPERESQTVSSNQKSSEGYQSSDTQTKKNQVQLDGNSMMDEVMREISKNVTRSNQRKME